MNDYTQDFEQRALAELAERLKLTYAAVKEGIWDWDLRDNSLEWSDRFLDLLGLTRADFTPEVDTFFNRLHPEDEADVRQALQDHIENDSPYDIRYRIRHEDGHYRPVRALGQTLRDPDGKPVRMVGSVEDISDQVATERALDASETRFQHLSANIPGAIFRYLIHQDGSDEIEYMSPGCLDIWEHDAVTIQGDPTRLWEAVLEEDFPAMRESVMRSAETLTAWSHKWRIETPSGVRKWLHGRGQPTRLENGPILWNSLILDITEQVETEQKLAESQEFFHRAQKLESLGKLTGGMAHDFNNLLGIILGNIELLNDMAPLGPYKSYVDNSIKAIERGSELTRSLLAFARRASLEPAPVAVEDVARDLQQMLRHTLPENIEFRTTVADNLPRLVIDRGALENALLNLVLNARDAISDHGQITVEFSEALAHTEDSGQGEQSPHIKICVTDNGCGMSPDLLKRVTEPFFTTKEAGKGTGLGLPSVDGFVKQSGGSMSIASEPGKGTCITLLFAVTSADAWQDEQPAGAMDDSALLFSQRGTILVVEDEPALRKVLCNRLTAEGYTVYEAQDGGEALAIYDQIQGGPDLLLCDFIVPGKIQGPEIAATLKSRQPDLAVIYLSGYADLNDARSTQEYFSADMRLYKPIGKMDLLRSVRQVLAAKAQARS